MMIRTLVLACVLALSGAPALTWAFSPSCLAPLCMSASGAQAKDDTPSRWHSYSPYIPKELRYRRREALSTVPLGLAGGLLLPSLAVAEEAMEWPDPLTADSVVSAGLIPAVGFGMYNTKAEVSYEAVSLALEAGVRHIDTATAYGNEKEIGKAWKASGLARDELKLSSKLCNTDLRSGNVRKAVESSLKKLQTDYLDAYYIHSPLASPEQRSRAWKQMHEMKQEGLLRSLGVCNFGVEKIQKLVAANNKLSPPELIQAEISPFNQRRDLVKYASSINAKVVCSAWSKLSNKDSGAKGWGEFAEICGSRGMTKAQGLVLWSLSRGLISIPRSGVGSEVEIKAIKDENSPRGMRTKTFTAEDLNRIDALGSEMLATGKLGRTDGWDAKDVTGPDFDPTTIKLPLVGWT